MNGELVFNGCGVSVLEDEKRSGDGWWSGLHDKVNVRNAAGGTLKNSENDKVMLCTCRHSKQKIT